MLIAELICSDEHCELVLEASGELAELDLLVCNDCGCCLQVVSLSAVEPVELHARVELGAPLELARAA